jgi:LemA protein
VFSFVTMSNSLIWWLLMALIVFWCVGLHNRLMRMRSRALGALGSVDKHAQHFSDLVRELGLGAGAMQQSLGPWAALLADLQELDLALKQAKATPADAQCLRQLGQTLDRLQATWHMLRAVPADLAGPVVPTAMEARWEVIAQRVGSAREGFNQIARKFNEALTQFPARLVVGIMGFRPSGLL